MDDSRFITVSSEADSFALTTKEKVKAELGITSNNDDALIDELIQQQSAAAADYCNRTFAQQTYIETIRLVDCRDLIVLRHRPIVSITSVVEDGTTLTEDDDYEVDEDAAILYRLVDDERQHWLAAKYVITYAAGYALIGDLPRGIEEAVRRMVKAAWFARSRDPLVKQVEVAGISSRSYWVGSAPGATEGLPPDIRALLDPHRDLSI